MNNLQNFTDQPEPPYRQVQLSWEGDRVKLEVQGSEPVDERLATVISSVRRRLELKSDFIDSAGLTFEVMPNALNEDVLHELSCILTEQANQLIRVIAH